METAPAKSNTGLIVLGVVAGIIVIGGGYYLLRRNSNPYAYNPGVYDPNNPLSYPIPGLPKTTAGDRAVGVLTDQNFFNGLNSLANNIYGMVKKDGSSQVNNTSSRGGGGRSGGIASDSSSGGSGGFGHESGHGVRLRA